MKRFVLVLLVLGLVLSLAAGAFAAAVTIQRGTYGTVKDAYIRDNNSDEPGWDEDMNFGNPLDPYGLRVYGDGGGAAAGKGERHMLVSFDLSFIPTGSTINSATFGEYYWGGDRPDILGLKVSRLQSGKTWVEGTGDTAWQDVGGFAVALNGEPTYNERMYGSGGWEIAGGTGATDIDLLTTKTYDLTGGDGFRTVNVTDFVNGWVNGGWANNGMLLWGGGGTGTNSYWYESVSEDGTVSLRPYLTVDYTEAPVPEPSSLLAFGAFGIAGLGLIRRRRA